jgi:transcriptional regulator with XRE-family HTH domain
MAENRIRMLRVMAKMSEADVASRVGVTENAVRRWETGQHGITDDNKLKLAELFDVSVPFLMGWPEKTNDHDARAVAG